MNLFEQLVPKLKLGFEPELAQLDRLLDDDVLFERVKADLCRRYPNSARLGRHSTPVEVILRMLVVKRLYNFSYEQTEHFVSDSIVLRQFCRLYLEPAPDDTTLIRWANTIGPETVASLNDQAVELARSLKVTRGRKLRVDSTVVETNVHPPTDSRLLGDGVRVVSRLLRRAREALGERAAYLGKGAFRTRNRSVRRLTKELHRIALRKGEKAAEELKEAYEKLVRVTRSSLTQAKRVGRALRERADERSRRLADKLEHYVPLIERGIDQAVRRVLNEEQVPAQEKVLSLFEDHTMIILPAARSEKAEGVRAQGAHRRGRGGHHKPLRGAFGGRQGAPAPTREHRGSPGALRTGARASDRRPRTLLQSQRRGRQKGGHKACRPAAEWPPYEEANGVRTAAMVQASLRVQSGRRRADQRAQEEIWPGALSLPWRRRHGPVGRLGDSGAQLGQDL